MDFIKSIPIFISGIFPFSMTNTLMFISPFDKSVINVVFVSIYHSISYYNSSLNNWCYSLLFDIFQHGQSNISTPLNQAKDWRFFFFQTTTTPCTLQTIASPFSPLSLYRFRIALVPSHNIYLINLSFPFQFSLGLLNSNIPTKLFCHLLDIPFIKIQLLGYLTIREIKPHEVQTQNPDPKWLMVPLKNGTG